MSEKDQGKTIILIGHGNFVDILLGEITKRDTNSSSKFNCYF